MNIPLIAVFRFAAFIEDHPDCAAVEIPGICEIQVGGKRAGAGSDDEEKDEGGRMKDEGKRRKWKDRKMERWKDGKMERWKDGKMERWKDGKRSRGRAGGHPGDADPEPASESGVRIFTNAATINFY